MADDKQRRADRIPNEKSILQGIHCRFCVEEVKLGLGRSPSPKNYARLSIGWTERGFQVWCERHQLNVIHVDFEGKKHIASTLGVVSSTWEEPYESQSNRYLRRLENSLLFELRWFNGNWKAYIDGLQVAERVPSEMQLHAPTAWMDRNWRIFIEKLCREENLAHQVDIIH